MARNKGKILVVDDNEGIRTTLNILLPKYFDNVQLIPSPKELNTCIREFRPDVILLDMNFCTDINTGNEGLFWLSKIKRMSEETEVVLFTAYADIALAVEGMKRGAFDFITKPWENDRLINILQTACEHRHKQQSNIPGSPGRTDTRPYWGESIQMRNIHNIVEKIAPTDASVLITGENGTGKDVLAKEIHRLSDRALKPLVCVDAGAITETLFESELFGHVKGAFTDAHSDRTGKFEEADGGTLFLDEIGNIPLHLQAKLLRALQNRAIVKVGDNKPVPIDIRLICATNKDLPQMVRDGRFREDLYYRINTMHIQLPPLRQRTDEIIPLSEIFISRFAQKYRRNVTGIDESAKSALLGHWWGGNIRELQNCIEKAVILADNNILTASGLFLSSDGPATGSLDNTDETLDTTESKAIKAAMDKYNGNISLVAKSLGISRPTLYAKLKKHNIG